MTRPHDVSVIIASWNVCELLRQSLRSLERGRGNRVIEIVVVDNASSDGTREMVAADFPDVRFIQMGENSGFARANNRGIRSCNGQYIFILNPDTVVERDCVPKLVEYMDSHQSVSMASPRVSNHDGSFQLGSIRSDPTVLSQLLIKLIHTKRLWRSIKPLALYLMADFDHDQEQEVKQIMGAAMFIRREALKRVGVFDEKFFIWFEDVDLCTRFRNNGEVIRYIPAARITHYGGQSFAQVETVSKQWLYIKSMLRYFFKHHGFASTALLAVCIPLQLLLTILYEYANRFSPARKN